METSTGVLRRFPSVAGAGAGGDINPSHHNSSSSKLSMLSFTEIRGNLKPKKLMVSSGFKDEGYLEYYNSSGRGSNSRIIRCGKKEKNKENDVALKKTKKKMKLLKGLSRDLFNLTDIGLVDQVQGKTISETAELLLGQLQQLKAEEKELKRKRKEEKTLMKMKRASQVQGITNREMSSSSSSSSESSDDECQNLVDMKSLKIGSLAQTIPEACERALKNATSAIENHVIEATSTIENHMIEPRTQNPEVDTSVEISSKSSTSNEDSTERMTSLAVPVPTILEQNKECCLEASDCYVGNVCSSPNAAVAATTTAAGTKKIEVCMGGKCKRSGAGAILEKFQQMVGIEAAVSGCKCMGKCKVGPNVRVSGCSSSSSSSDAFLAGDSVSVSSAPSSNNSLCIGVGLEDVSLIAANLLGRYPEVGLANALP